MYLSVLNRKYSLSQLLYFIILLVVVIALSLFCSIENENVYFFKGHISNKCQFQNATNKICPSCGNTRSLISFFHGEFKTSFNYNPVGFFIGCSIVVEVILYFLLLLNFIAFQPNIKYYSLLLSILMLISIIRYFYINN